MSPKSHQADRPERTLLDRTIASTNFIDFCRLLTKALHFDSIIVKTATPINYEGSKAEVKEIAIEGLEIETLFSYGELLIGKASTLLNGDLLNRTRTIDEINYLKNEEVYLKQEAALYNYFNPIGFTSKIKFLVINGDNHVECNSNLINLENSHFAYIGNALTYRYNILENIHHQVLTSLNERLLPLHLASSFEWNSNTPELDLCEIALSIIESPYFKVRSSVDPKLFVTKFLEMFGFSDKIFSHKRGDIAIRKPQNSILLKLHKVINEIHTSTPLPGTSPIKKSKNHSGN